MNTSAISRHKTGIVAGIIAICFALLCIAPGAALADNTKSTAYSLKLNSPYKVTMQKYDMGYWYEFTAPETAFYDFTGKLSSGSSLYIRVLNQSATSESDYIEFASYDKFTEKTQAAVLLNKGQKYYIKTSCYENGATVTLTATKHAHSLNVEKTYAYCKTCNAQLNIQLAGSYSYTYNGKAKKPKVKITISGNGVPTTSKYYKVSYAKNIKAGTATATVSGTGPFAGIKQSTSFYISKAKQRVTLVSTKTISKSKVNKKAQSFNVFKKAQGTKAAYWLQTNPPDAYKYFKVTRSGKVTVKKGTPKGTYRLRMYASAAGNSCYYADSTTSTLKIVVK